MFLWNEKNIHNLNFYKIYFLKKLHIVKKKKKKPQMTISIL